jgi:hypothetical protein
VLLDYQQQRLTHLESEHTIQKVTDVTVVLVELLRLKHLEVALYIQHLEVIHGQRLLELLLFQFYSLVREQQAKLELLIFVVVRDKWVWAAKAAAVAASVRLISILPHQVLVIV